MANMAPQDEVECLDRQPQDDNSINFPSKAYYWMCPRLPLLQNRTSSISRRLSRLFHLCSTAVYLRKNDVRPLVQPWGWRKAKCLLSYNSQAPWWIRVQPSRAQDVVSDVCFLYGYFCRVVSLAARCRLYLIKAVTTYYHSISLTAVPKCNEIHHDHFFFTSIFMSPNGSFDNFLLCLHDSKLPRAPEALCSITTYFTWSWCTKRYAIKRFNTHHRILAIRPHRVYFSQLTYDTPAFVNKVGSILRKYNTITK